MWEYMSHVGVRGRGGGGGDGDGDGGIHCTKAEKLCRDFELSAPDLKGSARSCCMTQCIYITKQHSEGQSTSTLCAAALACSCTGM